MSNDANPVAAKRLDEMNTLRDMGHFPPLVNAGATLNVLITITATLWVCRRFAGFPLALPAWIALVLTLNLMPVVVLRAVGWRATAPVPSVEQMDFVGDQHRFADWVYLAASANMAFWIMLSWCAFIVLPGAWTLPAVLSLALVSTFAPVWLRWIR
jgi:hypothetical protein